MCFPQQKKAKGEELFEQIMYHLDIVEKDYFGIRFMDSAQVPVRMEGVFSLCIGCLCLFIYLIIYPPLQILDLVLMYKK